MDGLNELPKYRCHKVVSAFKIAAVSAHGIDAAHGRAGVTLSPSIPTLSIVEVGFAFLNKHQPKPGGYYVRYEDGYESFSPAEAFEEGYTPVLQEESDPPARFDFGCAIDFLKIGFKVSRAGWNGKGMWLQLQRPDSGSKMGHPYIYMSGVDGKLFPWNPNQLDMLAEDWGIVE